MVYQGWKHRGRIQDYLTFLSSSLGTSEGTAMNHILLQQQCNVDLPSEQNNGPEYRHFPLEAAAGAMEGLEGVCVHCCSCLERGWTLGRVTGIMQLLSLSNFLSTDDNRNKEGKKNPLKQTNNPQPPIPLSSKNNTCNE